MTLGTGSKPYPSENSLSSQILRETDILHRFSSFLSRGGIREPVDRCQYHRRFGVLDLPREEVRRLLDPDAKADKRAHRSWNQFQARQRFAKLPRPLTLVSERFHGC